MLKGICLMLGFCLSAQLMADESGYFFGGGIGIADVGSSKQSEYNNVNLVQGSRLKVSEVLSYEFKDDTSLSYRLFGGYRFNKNIAVQLTAYDFGEVDVTQKFVNYYSDGSSSEGSKDYKLRNSAVSASGVFLYPINERISLFSTLGLAWSQQDERYTEVYYEPVIVNNSIRGYTSENHEYTETSDHVDLAYGVGAAYNITQQLSARLEFNGVELKDGRIFDFGLNLAYSL